MALKRDVRYPGRWTAASSGHPQGAFKNRTAPGSLDGSYIEQDWANDWDGFMSSLLSSAGIVANGTVDAVGASQYFDALGMLLNRSSGVVGTSRNARMSVPSASANVTLTADELVMKTALGGRARVVSGFNQPVNLAGVNGIGAMLTGLAPVSGYIALYGAIKDDGTVGAFAVDTTSALAPEVAAVLPAGYTASALHSVVRTDASRLVAPCLVSGRLVSFPTIQVINTTVPQGSPTLLSIASAVPINAKRASFRSSISAAVAGVSATVTVGSSSNQIGIRQMASVLPTSGVASTVELGFVSMVSPQTIYYTAATSTGAISGFNLSVVEYEF